MPVIFRWIFQGFFARALLTLFGLLAIYLIVESFDKARYLGHGLNAGLLVEYLFLKIPFMITEFMPIILLLASSIFVSELSHHNELIALRASGLGINKVLIPMLASAAVLASASFAIGEWVTPVTNARVDHIEDRNIHHKKITKHGIQWLKDGDRFLRLTPLGDQWFHLVLLEIQANGAWNRRIEAKRAHFEGDHWTLYEADIAEPDRTGDIRFNHVAEMRLPSRVGPATTAPPRPRHMNLLQLSGYIDTLDQAGLVSTPYKFTFQRKLATPFACMIMVLLSLALCNQMGARIGRRSWGIVGAIALGLLFHLLTDLGKLMALGERLPPALAAWLPVSFFGGLAVFLLLRKEGY